MTTHTNLRSILLTGATHTLLLRMAGYASMLLVSIVLGRNLGPEQYGIYAYSLAIINMLAIPASMGLPEFLTRQVAIYRDERSWALLRGLMSSANILVFSLSILIMSASAFIFIHFIDASDAPHRNFLIALILLPFLALTQIRSACLRGLQKIFFSQLPTALFQPVVFLILLTLLLHFTGRLTADSAMVLRIFSVSLSLFLATIFLRLLIPTEIKSVRPEIDASPWLKSAVSFLFLGGLFFVQNQIDIVMLGVFQPYSSIGMYKVVVVAASLVLFILHSVNAAAGPIIARLVKTGDLLELQSVVTLGTRMMFFGGLPLSVIFIFFGDTILGSIYGNEYALGASALRIRCYGQILNTACGSVIVILNMSGNERDTLRAYIAISLLNVVLNLILIPRFGIDGAAWATTISISISNIFLSVVVYRRLKIHSSIFGQYLLSAKREN